MLLQPAREVIGHADVQRAVPAARQDVDVVRHSHHVLWSWVPPSRGRHQLDDTRYTSSPRRRGPMNTSLGHRVLLNQSSTGFNKLLVSFVAWLGASGSQASRISASSSRVLDGEVA